MQKINHRKDIFIHMQYTIREVACFPWFRNDRPKYCFGIPSNIKDNIGKRFKFHLISFFPHNLYCDFHSTALIALLNHGIKKSSCEPKISSGSQRADGKKIFYFCPVVFVTCRTRFTFLGHSQTGCFHLLSVFMLSKAKQC